MKKVIIIGGGFAGSEIAKNLEKDFDVTLIDTKNYFEFTPWILRTIVHPSSIKQIQILHSHYLKKSKIIVGEVKEVHEKFVKVNGKKLDFDYLVIASGSRYELPFKDQKAIATTRAEHLRNNYEALCEAKNVVIVGGGLVGVELAGEILDKYSNKSVTIIQSGKNLIDRNSQKAIRYAEKYLRSKGATLLLNERVTNIAKKFCLTNKGTKIPSDLTFLCTGIKPNYEFLKHSASFILEKHNLIVNEFLQVNSFKNIFAAGDIAMIGEEKTAQNAEHHAKIVSHNIRALESNATLEKYESKRTPQVISLGKWHGIYDNGKTTIVGIIPALMKWAIKKKEIWKKRS